MTNYNERLDKIFAPLIDSPSLTLTTAYWDEAKQALTSLIKELVEEAKPELPVATSWQQGIEKKSLEDAIRVYEYRLLKALEEV